MKASVLSNSAGFYGLLLAADYKSTGLTTPLFMSVAKTSASAISYKKSLHN